MIGTMADSTPDRSTSLRSPGKVRLAEIRDVPDLVALRRRMFESMGTLTGDDAWEAVAAELFARELASGRLVAGLVDDPDGGDRAVASGVVMFECRLPAPGRTATTKAYISSMSTEPEWRRQGFARQILDRLVAVCEQRGVHAVELRATDDGRPLYESFGFEADIGMPLLRRYVAPDG
jgi:GNAT superfamily N-acetyltransferase